MVQDGTIAIQTTATSPIRHHPIRTAVLVGVASIVTLASVYVMMRPDSTTIESTTPLTGSVDRISAPQSLAVLPFVNMSTDDDQEVFVDGLSVELMNRLANLPGLRVAGRTSSFSFKGKNVGYDEIGTDLGVAQVLEGSVRKDGSSLRITAKLINVSDGFELWSASYDRELNDIFAIQREIAAAVANAMSIELDIDPGNYEYGGTEDARAQAYYLRGLGTIQSGSDRTISEFKQAIDIDPGFALAWVTLSYAHGTRSRDPAHKEAALADMAAAAARAVELAPDHWETQAVSGWALLSYHDFVGAERAIQKAMELALRTEATENLLAPAISDYLGNVGRHNEALERIRDRQRIDPFASSPISSAVRTLYLLGRRDEALVEYERNKDRLTGSRTFLTGSRAFRRWFAMEGTDSGPMDEFLAGTGLEGKWGSPDEILPILRRGLDELPALRRGFFADRAMYAALHGDTELALAYLRREYDDVGFGAYYLMWHPALREVRKTPGFKSFVRELGLLDMWRASGRWNDYCHPLGSDDFECQ
jgi:TolB-like protein